MIGRADIEGSNSNVAMNKAEEIEISNRYHQKGIETDQSARSKVFAPNRCQKGIEIDQSATSKVSRWARLGAITA